MPAGQAFFSAVAYAFPVIGTCLKCAKFPVVFSGTAVSGITKNSREGMIPALAGLTP